MNLKAIYNSIVKDTRAVSPVVASLILVVVAVVGAATIGVMMGVVGEDVGEQADADQVGDASRAMIQIGAYVDVWDQIRPMAESFSEANPGVGFIRRDMHDIHTYDAVIMGIADIGISDFKGRHTASYTGRGATDCQFNPNVFLASYNLEEESTVIELIDRLDNIVPTQIFLTTHEDASPIEQAFVDYMQLHSFIAPLDSEVRERREVMQRGGLIITDGVNSQIREMDWIKDRPNVSSFDVTSRGVTHNFTGVPLRDLIPSGWFVTGENVTVIAGTDCWMHTHGYDGILATVPGDTVYIVFYSDGSPLTGRDGPLRIINRDFALRMGCIRNVAELKIVP